MGLFTKKTTPAVIGTAPVSAPPPTAGGAINLSKGDTVNLAKAASGDEVMLTCSWPDSTDYDLYALVEYADGHTEHVATFGATGILPASRTNDGAVVHAGDQARGDGTGRGHLASETIAIRLNPSILTVVPVVYSAQSNGTGSFRKYGVTSSVVCGDQQVTIDARDASDDRTVYSLVPAVISNGPDGAKVSAAEQYSARGSERRPAVRNGVVTMDAGPRNAYK